MGKGKGSSSSDTMTITTMTTHGGYYGGAGGANMASGYYGSMAGGYPTGYPSAYGYGSQYPGSVVPGSMAPGTINMGAPNPYDPYGRGAFDSVAMSVQGVGSMVPGGVGAPGSAYQPVISIGTPVVSGADGRSGLGPGGVGAPGAGVAPSYLPPGGAGVPGAGGLGGAGGPGGPGGPGAGGPGTVVLPSAVGAGGAGRDGPGGVGVGGPGGAGAGVGGPTTPVVAVSGNTTTQTQRVAQPPASGRLFGQAIVLDNGGGLTKVGFAGEQYPRVVVPSLVGVPKHTGFMSQVENKPFYVGTEAQLKRGVLLLQRPIDHGVVKDWNNMERVWEHAFRDELKANTAELPILATEAPMNPRKNREDIARVLFEKFNAPAVFIASEAPLALYALGRRTGLVLELGHGVVNAVPVVEGYTIAEGILRLNIGGDDITSYLERILKERGYSFPTTAEHEIVQDIKEKLGYVAVDYDAELKKNPHEVEKQYELPDGQQISIGDARFRCTEILFKPALLGMDTYGVAEMVAASVEKCNLTLRNDLLSNIVLSGGTSMFPGFPERLLRELQKLVPHNTNISIIAHPQRKYAVWHGGSVLASHPDFQSLWITRKAYQEQGPSILHDKMYQ